jgi:hypothetical protein
MIMTREREVSASKSVVKLFHGFDGTLGDFRGEII